MNFKTRILSTPRQRLSFTYAMIVAVIILTALFLSGCSASWHLKQAIRKGSKVSSDTVYVEKSVIVPEVRTDTVFQAIAGDTVTIERERLKIKYVKLPGDSVYIEGKCESDTVRISVPTYINTTIKAPPPKMTIFKCVLISIGVGILCFVVGFLLGKFL